jgi:hypothetical protein
MRVSRMTELERERAEDPGRYSRNMDCPNMDVKKPTMSRRLGLGVSTLFNVASSTSHYLPTKNRSCSRNSLRRAKSGADADDGDRLFSVCSNDPQLTSTTGLLLDRRVAAQEGDDDARGSRKKRIPEFFAPVRRRCPAVV